MRFFVAFSYACMLSFLAASAAAQVSAPEARRMGLEIAWQSQVQIARSGTGVVSSHLWVDANKPRKFAIVELEDRTIRISVDKLDKYGAPIGMEGAKQQATEQAARLLGKNEGFEVVEATVPQIKLVLVTNDGLVQTLDAETGKLLWATACGESNAPAHPAAVSPIGVVLIHGEALYLLDWETGGHLKKKQLRFASANAVALCNDIAFVSDFTGRVESYGLGAEELRPWSYLIKGRVIGKPVSLANQKFCAVASNEGYVYVFNGEGEPSVWIRFETSSAINGSLSAGNNAFYAGSAGGLVSKISVDDRLGLLKWQFPAGQTITARPLVIGNQVIAVTESGDVLSIEDETGQAAWIRAGLGMAEPIAKAVGNIFCTSLSGEIYAFNADNGNVVAKSLPLNLAKPIVNQVDNRVYVLARDGRLQCLRPVGAGLPTLVTPVVPAEEAAEPEPAPEQPETGPSGANPFNFGNTGGAAAGSPFDAANPFGGAANTGAAAGAGDPFGGGGGGSDPFGGGAGTGADPFGGGGAGTGTDPFGGGGAGTGADPFGGGAGTGNPFGGGSDPFGTGN